MQSNAIPESHASVVICPMTSALVEAVFRVPVMADKPVTIRRERIARRIGQLGATDMARLNVALAFVMGLAD